MNSTNDYIKAIDSAMLKYLSGAIQGKLEHTGELYNSVEYSIVAGGKRIRPLVLIGACLAAGGDAETALPFACAIELIHTYSLIHDDLPAMDNSDTRRGKPSNHIKFGEAAAILAGDGLLNLAYEVMLSACVENPCEKTVRAAFIIAAAAGIGGMVGGQSADLFYEKKDASADALAFIHANKTAALFSAAGEAGAVLGGASDLEAVMYRDALKAIGLAFQIKDDIENETGDAAVLGKPVGNDAVNRKNTYVSVYGMDKARSDLEGFVTAGLKGLEGLCGRDGYLLKLVNKAYG